MVLGLWFESVRVMFPLFYYFKRASRSHAKTGSFLPFFRCLFSSAFSEGRQNDLFQFSFVFGSLEGPFFSAFFVLLPFSCEKW